MIDKSCFDYQYEQEMLFISPKRPDTLWGQPTLLLGGLGGGSFPDVKAAYA